MARMAAIGVQDFGKIIENHYFYIDKTKLIKDWWESGDAVTLIARPRRFGKTLTMDMLYKFFSVRQENGGTLFQNLNIWKEEKYRSLQGTYPVIFLSFADVKCTNYEEAFSAICEKPFWTAIDEQIVFQELDGGDEEVWSLLLASGYLKAVGYKVVELEFGERDEQYELAFTNLETRMAFRKLIHGWFANQRYGYNDFIKALLAGDLDYMNTYMNKVALCMVSHFDSGTKPSEQVEPERFYHGFVLGMMVDLDSRYVITSNRESGFGRYDVLLEPRDDRDDGILFEFKVFHPKRDADLQAAADAAVRQILDKKYADLLKAKGVPEDKIRVYGFAFRGKQVLIEGGYILELYGKGDTNERFE